MGGGVKTDESGEDFGVVVIVFAKRLKILHKLLVSVANSFRKHISSLDPT